MVDLFREEKMNYCFDYISPELKTVIEPAINVSHHFEKKMGYRVIKNGYVAPYYYYDRSIGCVIDEKGKAIKDSECVEWKENEAFYQLEEAVHEHKKVVFLGFLLNCFGHSYTDDLRKLWFLETEECRLLLERGAVLVYTTSWNEPISESVLEVFRLAGCDLSQARHINKLIQFDEVYIPDNSFVSSDYGRLYCDEYKKTIERIKHNVPIGISWGEKIYFSRTKYSNDKLIDGMKKEIGEKSIEQVFRKLGYTIISPEDYSVVEQIQMVSQCKSFAATEGSVSHMSLFCQPKTKIVIINKANYLNFHQVMINEFADLDVMYIEAHHSVKTNQDYPWSGPFYLCVNKYLERYVGHMIPHVPYWILPSYWEYTCNIPYKCYNRVRKLFRRYLIRNC